MGSVIDYIECPNCKHEAFSDFYYKTGEEYVNCNNCGYHYSATYKRNEDGKFVTKDGTEDYKFENLIMVENKLEDPFGAYRIKVYHSPATQCSGYLQAQRSGTHTPCHRARTLRPSCGLRSRLSRSASASGTSLD